MIAAYPDHAGDLEDEVVPFGSFFGVVSLGFIEKLFRLNRKTPAHLVQGLVQSRPRTWKRTAPRGDFRFFTA